MVTCRKWTPVISYPTKIKSELCASVVVIGSSNCLSWQLLSSPLRFLDLCQNHKRSLVYKCGRFCILIDPNHSIQLQIGLLDPLSYITKGGVHLSLIIGWWNFLFSHINIRPFITFSLFVHKNFQLWKCPSPYSRGWMHMNILNN